jgi:hypothetical protein
MGEDSHLRGSPQTPLTCNSRRALCYNRCVSGTPKARRILRGWRVFLVTLVVLGCCAWLDTQIKARAGIDGYCPDNAAWIVATQDFGTLWRRASQTSAVERLCEEWPRPLAGVELAIRKATGIRPTPARWRLWMGDRLLVAGSDLGSGLCVYPGVLTRMVHWVRRATLRGGRQDGVYAFGDLHYAWRNGFLIASRSRGYVAASLDAQPPDLPAADRRDEVRCVWRGRRESTFCVRPDEGFPVEGRVRVAITERATPLTLTHAWPEPPLFAVTATSPEDLGTLLAALGQPFSDTAGWQEIVRISSVIRRQWGVGELPEGWNKGLSQCGFALLDVDTSQSLPVPELALILRGTRPAAGPHPLQPLFDAFDAVPYQWQGQPGGFHAVLGQGISACLGRSGRDWIATSREPAMDALVGQLASGPATNADATVRLRWDAAGTAAESVVNRMAGLELLGRQNKRDAAMMWLPMTRGIARAGVLELDGDVNNGWLTFHGCLARELEESEP